MTLFRSPISSRVWRGWVYTPQTEGQTPVKRFAEPLGKD
jgi:hypothetical protein